MTCREFVEFMYSYVSGELSPAERGEFDRHLQVCTSCVNYLDSYRKTIELGKAAFADEDGPLPEDVPEDLIRAILAARDRNA